MDPWSDGGPPVDEDGLWRRPELREARAHVGWRPVRGGAWSVGIDLCQLANRFSTPVDYHHAIFGLGACRSYLGER